PVEDADVQPAAPAHQEVEEVAELGGRAALRHGIEVQAGAAVEVPGEDDDRSLGFQRRAMEGFEIVLRVDEQRDALRVRHAPDVVAGAKERLLFARRRGGGAAALTPAEVDDAPHRATLAADR